MTLKSMEDSALVSLSAEIQNGDGSCPVMTFMGQSTFPQN